ncbi:vWA domain-containing protein [Vibrio sp. 99-70-13A1]|uniref:TadE/TadG family type IV pilus assembly protein n=1 Tax=Vibrio sp. 99-70-13A1 TaxID=2607601 RepID=UPI001493AD35|nr:vWA domain-containing protein [Vibrio sp. 99-70-13A1]NOH95860.1 VWA domain-containing protein [Vibrio sp. 99-70-13A1]
MKKLPQIKWKRSKGLVAILTVLALPILLAVIGLAVDTGRTFLVKAKLFSAVDAASIAAARAVANGEDAGREAANRYFSANMPADFHNSTATLNNVNYGYDEFGNISIDINATVEVPNLFLSILGFDSFESSVEAQSVRRPVDLVLVIDNTTSLRYGSIGDVTQDVVDRSKSFVENFHESFDRISLVKFAFGAQVPVEFTDARGHSRSDITTAIDAFNFGSYWNAQYTNASEGMYRALDEIRNVSDPANLKVIVFFTDGAPNTFASHFEFTDGNIHAGAIRTNDESSGTPYGLWRHDSMATKLSGDGYAGSSIYSDLEELPEHYNPHDEDEAEFKVLNPSHSVRPVTQYTTNSTSQLFTKVNRVARNLVEDMAEAARLEGTYVFTLGLGSSLTSTSGPDSEYGEDLLLRMANDPAMLDDTDLAGDYKSDQLEGVYCHAVDEQALGPCFDQMLDVIIRLTM